MDVQPIEMPYYEARKRFLAYRNSVRERLTDEDVTLMEGYRALARGAKVINVISVLREAGLDEQLRPRLAVIRADAKWCHLRVESNRIRLGTSTNAFWGGWCKSAVIELPLSTFPFPRGTSYDARAVVPTVPINLRPKGDLKGYHILWEAEWGPVAPVDPLLLKIIRWPLFAILAQWDLTPLEQAVLEGRIR